MTKAPFQHHAAALEYADANGLHLVWEGTQAFEKRQRTLPPDQFEIRAVLTRKGITNAGLFSKQITRAEFLADKPRRDRMAARRMALRAKKNPPAT
jgi:hypothetical protein